MRRLGHLTLALTVGTALALLSGGCPLDWLNGTTTTTKGTALKRFASADELLGFFRQRALENSTGTVRSASGVSYDLALAPTAAGGSEAAGNSSEQGSSTTAYSTTNIQEEGVDESDQFKSDGTNFYLAKGQSLRIVRATPFDGMAEIGRVDFDYPVDSFYLYGQHALVLLQKSPYATYYAEGGVRTLMGVAEIWPPYYEKSSVIVAAVDITDPNAPAVTATNELDGSLVSSRLTNDRLLLVLAYQPSLPYNVNVLTLNALAVEDVLPMMRTASGDALAVAPENCYYPESPAGYSITTVVTLDAANIESQLGSVGVMANAQTIYASTEAVYVTATDYDPNDNYRERTNIHKFALGNEGVAEYIASGAVPGGLLNQFSLGEDQGYLRVATHTDATFASIMIGPFVAGVATDSASAPGSPDANSTTSSDQAVAAVPTDSTPAANGVYVLNQTSDGKLAIVGALAGIAPTEKLYSARFLGNRGYLVTFKQIDPLFVLDLSDPTKPTELGSLKIPGYSDYLHPFGDLLIGVGQAVGQSDWGSTMRRGVQLSLFNVSDPQNPTVVQQVEIGSYGSSTEVSNSHKAFTFLPEQGLLAIPVRTTSTDPNRPYYDYIPELDGVVCYRVSATGFEALGSLSAVTDAVDNGGWGWNWDWTWRRAAFIGDTLYAITPAGVRAAAVAQLSDPNAPRPTLTLQPEPDINAVGGSSGGAGSGAGGGTPGTVEPTTGSGGG